MMNSGKFLSYLSVFLKKPDAEAEIYGSADGTNFTKLVDAKYNVSGSK